MPICSPWYIVHFTDNAAFPIVLHLGNHTKPEQMTLQFCCYVSNI